MLDIVKNTLNIPKKLIAQKIREKAIYNAKERLMQEQLTPEELGLEKFEIIVHEEVEKINNKLKDTSILTLVGALGLDFLAG